MAKVVRYSVMASGNLFCWYILFLLFLSAPFYLGHHRGRGGAESEASVCFAGGNRSGVEGGTGKAEDAKL